MIDLRKILERKLEEALFYLIEFTKQFSNYEIDMLETKTNQKQNEIDMLESIIEQKDDKTKNENDLDKLHTFYEEIEKLMEIKEEKEKEFLSIQPLDEIQARIKLTMECLFLIGKAYSIDFNKKYKKYEKKITAFRRDKR